MTITFALIMACCLLATTASATEQEPVECPPGQVLGLNNKCFKKFVLPKRKKCSEPVLPPFGQSYQLELGGRMVQYTCVNGWAIYGEAKAFCKLGVWDPPQAPSCIRAGCEDVTASEDVTAVYEMDRAAVRFECLRDGYVLDGSPSLTCDGQFWNGTVPTCKEVRAQPLNHGPSLATSDALVTLIATALLLRNYLL